MWVQKSVMNIVDLGSELFLVYLLRKEDYDKALANGP